jgi:hypothetical protein
VKSKLKSANLVMSRVVLKVVEVIDVIDFHFVVFSLFKVIRDLKRLNPFRVEVVHDHFSLS